MGFWVVWLQLGCRVWSLRLLVVGFTFYAIPELRYCSEAFSLLGVFGVCV